MEHLLLHAVLLVVKWMAMLEKVLDDTHPKFDFDQSPTCSCAHERKRENTYIMASIHPCCTDLRKPPIQTCARTSPRRHKAFVALSECRNRRPCRSRRRQTQSLASYQHAATLHSTTLYTQRCQASYHQQQQCHEKVCTGEADSGNRMLRDNN